MLPILDRACAGLLVKHGLGFSFSTSSALILKGLYNRELPWHCSFALLSGYDEVGEHLLVLWYILLFDRTVQG